MVLPVSLMAEISRLAGVPVEDVQPVAGGDISYAARIVIKGEPRLIKWHPDSPIPTPGWPDLFTAEAHGLNLLAQQKILRVPRVLAHSSTTDVPPFIVLEWIERGSTSDADAAARALGAGLAALHRVTTDRYGLDENNYCGTTPQLNTWCESWLEFYGERRLQYQMEIAARKGRMPAERRRLLEGVIANLGRWIDDKEIRPSLLHGDLWGGNWLIGPHGEPVLIDPAVYFGDREAELAMCHLFGGFPAGFFRAYDEAWPPRPGRAERIELYQLYHLLNHLNLFGEAYGGRVDTVLRRYAR